MKVKLDTNYKIGDKVYNDFEEEWHTISGFTLSYVAKENGFTYLEDDITNRPLKHLLKDLDNGVS